LQVLGWKPDNTEIEMIVSSVWWWRTAQMHTNGVSPDFAPPVPRYMTPVDPGA